MATIKTLRVCTSSDLPAKRDSNFFYFAYDKLLLYQGMNLVDDNFAIVDTIPSSPVYGMMYILTSDGSIHKNIDYKDTKIANIENSSQLSILKKAGTSFLVNSDHRYIDQRTRTVVLPYTNGTYDLTVQPRNDAVIDDDNTVLKYNQETERFEPYSDNGQPYIDYSKKFRGGTTNTVALRVSGHKILADIRLSRNPDNLIKAAYDGLYVKGGDKIDKETFDSWANQVSEFRKHANDVLDNIDAEIKNMTEMVSPENLNKNIKELTEARFPTIQTALNDYRDLQQKITDIEDEIIAYANSRFTESTNSIESTVRDYGTWNDLDDVAEEYVLTNDDISVLLSAAVSSYLAAEAEENEKNKEDNSNE